MRGAVGLKGLQRQLPGQIIGEVAYVGTRHEKLWTNVARNSIPSAALSQGVALDALVPNPFFGTIKTGDGLLTAANTRASQLLKPYPQYVGITRFRDSVGDSWYNGLTLRVEKRSAKGLTYQAAYTLSREEDTVPERFGSRGSVIIDPNDLSIEPFDLAEHERLTTEFPLPSAWEQPI